MLSAKFLTILALFATSATALSVGNGAHHPHRRHAHKAVIGSRSARGSEGAHAHLVSKRDVLPAPRKRGMNARRCAPKTTSVLPTSTSSADPAPTESDPAPKTTTSSVKTSSAEPTKTKAATTSTSDKPTKTSTSVKETQTDDGGSSSGGSGTFTGQATFYGTGLGACGIVNTDTDYIAAASKLLYDGFQGYTGGNPNDNPICGKKVTAHYQGKTVKVIITDRCEACAKYDLDFAPSAFNQLADPSLGRLSGMSWSFN